MAKWARAVVLMGGLFLFALGASAGFSPLKLDTVHSKIGFTASTLLFDVDGRFKAYDLQVDGDPGKPAQAKVKLVIDAASIDTGNSKRDEHLSGPDFLDVKKYPKITFTSETITQAPNALDVTGTLDLHGVQKKLTIPFKMVKGKNGAGVDTTAFKGKLIINRNDFRVGTDSVAVKISLEDEVAIELLVVAFL